MSRESLIASCRLAHSSAAIRCKQELKDFLHGKQALGVDPVRPSLPIRPARAIGHRTTPLKPPESVDYDLWLGPANDEPIYRDKLHYDWHWNWNTGNGEMGNWGVHVLDDAINVVLRDRVPFPLRVAAAGGRVLWKDAGQTPNVSIRVLRHGLDSHAVRHEQPADRTRRLARTRVQRREKRIRRPLRRRILRRPARRRRCYTITTAN